MTDYISREDLLDLYSLDGLTEEEQSYGVPYAVIRQTVLDMPAADVKPIVKGEWMVICSCCGHSSYDRTDFCPNCGADMRERVSEDD